MTSELQAMFAHAQAQHEAAAAGELMDEVSRARVRNHIKRAGTWRSVRMAGVAAAAAGVLAVGAWFGTSSLRDEDPAVPLPSATPSVSQAPQSPSPSPSPSPTQTLSEAETPDPELAQFVASLDPDLYPDALPVTQAVWDQVGEGWALATYQPIAGGNREVGDVEGALGPQLLLLASPTGELFVAAELPADSAIRLITWDVASGTAEVVVRVGPAGPSSWETASVDVSTGELTAGNVVEVPNSMQDVNIASWSDGFVDATGAWQCARIDDAAESGYVVCADVLPVFDYCGADPSAGDPEPNCAPLDYVEPSIGGRHPFIGRVDTATGTSVTALYPLSPDDPYPATPGFRVGDTTTTVGTTTWIDFPWIDGMGDVVVRVTEASIEVIGENPSGERAMRTVFPSVGGTWVARTSGYDAPAPYDLAFVANDGAITTVIPAPALVSDNTEIVFSLRSVTVAR